MNKQSTTLNKMEFYQPPRAESEHDILVAEMMAMEDRARYVRENNLWNSSAGIDWVESANDLLNRLDKYKKKQDEQRAILERSISL